MIPQNENSIAPRRIKQHAKPPDKTPYDRETPPPTQRLQRDPMTIVIPPRQIPAKNRSGTPTTPTRTTGKRHLEPEDNTPTALRTKRYTHDQREITAPQDIDNTQIHPQEQDQNMDEDGSSSIYNQAPASPTSQEDHEPSTQGNEEPMPDSDPLTDDLLSLLLNIEDIVTALKQEGRLDAIIKEEDIACTLLRLSASLPIIPTNLQIEPLMNQIGNLCQKMDSLTDTIGNRPSTSPPNHTLQDSIHAPGQSTPSRNTSPNTTKLYTSVLQANETPNHLQPTKPSNPRLAHHHTRLVAQFLPNGIPASNRRDPGEIVMKINKALVTSAKTKHLKVVAANYNRQGNIILSTRTDQSAADLAKHEDIIKPVLVSISGIQNITIRDDKKWFKIQIDGVSTGNITIGGERLMHQGETIHDELAACNPIYARLTKHIVAKPRWLRTNEEIQAIPRSSLVFALDDEIAAKSILNHRALAAFGRHCSLRAFQERPPVTQCRKCWKFDHKTDHCNGETCCRICSGPHHETDHQTTDPTACNKCALARELGDMDTTLEGQCPHQLRCTNCVIDYEKDHEHPADSRRCPTRLSKYGTARDNERKTQKSENPWTKIKPKKTSAKKRGTPGQAPATQPSPTPGPSQNRYAPIEPLATDTPQQVIDEYIQIAQSTRDNPQSQPWI